MFLCLFKKLTPGHKDGSHGGHLHGGTKANGMPRRDAFFLDTEGLEMQNQDLLNRADFGIKRRAGGAALASSVNYASST